jgi:hypothetical protein
VAPWSAVWEHNRFAEARPAFEAFVKSPYARGGVTGVGVITALAGVAEIGSIFVSRRRRQDVDTPPPSTP